MSSKSKRHPNTPRPTSGSEPRTSHQPSSPKPFLHTNTKRKRGREHVRPPSTTPLSFTSRIRFFRQRRRRRGASATPQNRTFITGLLRTDLRLGVVLQNEPIFFDAMPELCS